MHNRILYYKIIIEPWATRKYAWIVGNTLFQNLRILLFVNIVCYFQKKGFGVR